MTIHRLLRIGLVSFRALTVGVYAVPTPNWPHWADVLVASYFAAMGTFFAMHD